MIKTKMGPPKKGPMKGLSPRLNITALRLEAWEREKVEQDAKSAGLSLSDYLRRRLGLKARPK
jgi:hypothetical protein